MRRCQPVRSGFLFAVLLFEVALVQDIPFAAAGWHLARQGRDLAPNDFVELGLALALRFQGALDLGEHMPLALDLRQAFLAQHRHDLVRKVGQAAFAEPDHSVKPRSLARRALMPSMRLRWSIPAAWRPSFSASSSASRSRASSARRLSRMSLLTLAISCLSSTFDFTKPCLRRARTTSSASRVISASLIRIGGTIASPPRGGK